MGYKLKGALKKSRPILIMLLILWVGLSIVFIAPVTVSIVEASNNAELKFTEIIFERFGTIGENLGKIFTPDYIGTFAKGDLYLIIALLFVGAIGFVKAMPKNEYTDIEHGSSAWAEGGEQYRVLSPKKGIILAEKNYLPVNKRGNVNVLVVGRFWFW